MELVMTRFVDRLPVAATRLLAVCGLAAPVLFTLGIIAAAWQNPGYSHISRAISELASVDAAAPVTQTLNFVATGVLTIAFALGLGRRPAGRLGALLFGTLGVVMIAHGALPCDAGCQFVTPVGTAHNVLGMLGFVAAVAGVWLSGRARRGGFRLYSSISAAAASIGLLSWIALAKVAGVAAANGSLQRLFVAILLAWMFVTAWRQVTVGEAQ
jgi:hypothetical membrane protein